MYRKRRYPARMEKTSSVLWKSGLLHGVLQVNMSVQCRQLCTVYLHHHANNKNYYILFDFWLYSDFIHFTNRYLSVKKCNYSFYQRIIEIFLESWCHDELKKKMMFFKYNFPFRFFSFMNWDLSISGSKFMNIDNVMVICSR